jgi:hypothetical protein
MKKRIALTAAVTLLAAVTLTAQTPAKPSAGNSSQSPVKTPAQTSAKVSAQTPAKPDPWLPVRFLLGSWESKTTGGLAQAQASAGYSFRLELREHIVARHTRSGVCAAPDDFDCQHSDLLYIYPEGSGFKAIYFDNEGHVIHYDLSIPKPGSVVFLSDAALEGPQYRLSYELLNGAMSGKFELKMPNQTEFLSYLEWSGHQR